MPEDKMPEDKIPEDKMPGAKMPGDKMPENEKLFLRYSVSFCEKTVYNIFFTFDKLGILMRFSCYHMRHVFYSV